MEMIDRDRNADLDKLADAIIGEMKSVPFTAMKEGVSPFGEVEYSVAEVIGMEPEGDNGVPYLCSSRQSDYTSYLWEDVFDHIRARWAAFRKAEEKS